jgi:energy-coupling factor transport system permease protein
MRTTNPFLLGLVIAVVAFVVAARRTSAPWARSFASFARLAVFVVVFRVLLQILFGVRIPGTTLFTLPSIDLPSFMAGVSVGGPVTAEALVGAFSQGLRLATVLVCFGAVNTLCSPYRMLRTLPASLYEAGVAVTVALSFAPQAVIQIGRIREARRLRGRPVRGVAGLRGMALPVLEGALDRSVALAASMDTRGYGRRATVAPGIRRVTTAATGLGLLAVAVGLYGVLDAGAPRALGLPLLGVGAFALSASLFVGGRQAVRTRYRPDRWRLQEWGVGASGLAALLALIIVARMPGGAEALEPSLYPLTWPVLPWLAVVGVAVGLAPSIVAPRPPSLDAAPPAEPRAGAAGAGASDRPAPALISVPVSVPVSDVDAGPVPVTVTAAAAASAPTDAAPADQIVVA